MGDVIGTYKKSVWGRTKTGGLYADLDTIDKDYMQFYERVAKYIDVTKIGKSKFKVMRDFDIGKTELQKQSNKDQQTFSQFLLQELGIDFVVRKTDGKANKRIQTLFYVHCGCKARYAVRRKGKQYQVYDTIQKKYVGKPESQPFELEVVRPKGKKSYSVRKKHKRNEIVGWTKSIWVEPDQRRTPVRTEQDINTESKSKYQIKQEGNIFRIYHRDKKTITKHKFNVKPVFNFEPIPNTNRIRIRDKKTGQFVGEVKKG